MIDDTSNAFDIKKNLKKKVLLHENGLGTPKRGNHQRERGGKSITALQFGTKADSFKR